MRPLEFPVTAQIFNDGVDKGGNIGTIGGSTGSMGMTNCPLQGTMEDHLVVVLLLMLLRCRNNQLLLQKGVLRWCSIVPR